jgi:hypothetical protein
MGTAYATPIPNNATLYEDDMLGSELRAEPPLARALQP